MYLNSLAARMLAAFALTAPVSASVIIDLEPNDSLAGAQNIDGSFSTGANGDIGPDPTLIPWVSESDNTPQATNGGWDPTLAEPIQSGGTYDLQVSLQPVPEPTTFLSVLMAFGWFAVGRRSRQS